MDLAWYFGDGFAHSFGLADEVQFDLTGFAVKRDV